MNEGDGVVHNQNQEVSPSAAVIGCPPDMTVSENAREQIHWYVMRSTYCREVKAREMLEADGVECYVPMRTMRSEQSERVVPVVHNLVFVRTNRDYMDQWKRRHEEDCPLRYTIDRSTSLPMIVRDRAMEDFIRVTKDADDEILYLDNPNVAVEKGKQIEIVCGQYAGVRGTILRILRDRKVVVSAGGLVAVAISGIPTSTVMAATPSTTSPSASTVSLPPLPAPHTAASTTPAPLPPPPPPSPLATRCWREKNDNFRKFTLHLR